jgi:hypothetical protein
MAAAFSFAELELLQKHIRKNNRIFTEVQVLFFVSFVKDHKK